MKVRELLECKETCYETSIEVSGILVFIDKELFLIDEDYGEDYKSAPQIRIAFQDLEYALMNQVALEGGGESVLFHKALILGGVTKLTDKYSEIVLNPISINVESCTKDGWIKIDFSARAIKAGKTRREGFKEVDFLNDLAKRGSS